MKSMRSQNAEAVDTPEARKPQVGVLGMRPQDRGVYDTYERELRDLPCFEFRTTVVVELYRVRCPDCGIKTEKVPQLLSKAPFSKRFEEAVGLACESAAVRRVARQFGLAASTVRAMDLRYLKRWAASRRKPALRHMGIDEIYLGKKQKFVTGSEQSADRGTAVDGPRPEERNPG
jgi:transposase